VKLLVQREMILNVSKMWDRQYKLPNGEYRVHHMNPRDFAEIGKKLASMDLSRATAEEVNAVIGNDSWTRSACSECRDYNCPDVVIVAEDTYLCRKCVAAAYELIRKK